MRRLQAWRQHELSKAVFAICIAFVGIKILFGFVSLILPFAPEPIGSRAELFTEGSSRTLSLTLSAGGIGLCIGFLLGLCKLYSKPAIRTITSALIGLLRGTPLLVQIFFFYYAIPVLIPALKLDEFSAALVALAFNVGAYNAEVIRSGILAIPRGQFEAAYSLGLSRWHTMRYVVLPQALKIMIPPLMNNSVALLKDSSLASSIGLLELSLVGNRITSETFLPVPVLVTVASIYLLQSTVLSGAVRFLEERLRSI